MYYLFLIIPTWYLYHFIEYGLHKIGHNYKLNSYIYKIHMNHHKKYYPISKLLNKKPYKTGYKYNISDGMIAYGPSMLLIFSGMYFLFDFYTYLIIISQIILFAYISDYIHTEIHIDGSWLEKYNWFIQKRKLHLIHHKRTNKNINIIDHSLDKLFNSYCKN